MTIQFKYYTQTQGTKTVLLFDSKVHNYFLVEVAPETGMADKIKSYKFNTLEEAEKKFNSIKKRVSNKLV